ncbi:Cell division-associated, ATP-dependent zinc metalloprotease FtsH (plasmid) [Cupriavidus sp. U2]|uniref:ATP-binding protein n=1 Tax=Cupriavidus sp. U2 TaxID=2920269 RepID=UPI00129DF5A2|nr:ATP-binding protein [Cupriavidus sp. U2]KAI3592069.1 Cell division-associated, ATP-dependent zinc metalloprotease FtsH [Cupriavidus sp. U2]
MALEAWLPIGFKLEGGAHTGLALFTGHDWQIVDTRDGGRALVVGEDLHKRWRGAGLIREGQLQEFDFGPRRLFSLTSGSGQVLSPVFGGASPNTKAEALSFAVALKETRRLDADTPIQDALYVERISRLLPTYGITPRVDDDVVLGCWLTGGVPISAKSVRRLRQTLTWLGAKHLQDVIEAAGIASSSIIPAADGVSRVEVADGECPRVTASGREQEERRQFVLAGRPALTAFFNEHVVDIIENRERYKALGIDFPGAVILHGPPGCGKTFAVEQLVDFLGWPSFAIDASSIASPYIHETSRKVAEIFESAIKSAPSVLVIDEMEAFVADREFGNGHHRVEEVAEFLRRIPEAVKNDVLIIGMTNRIDMIDPAIQRRGRFDHVLNVGYASAAEVEALLDSMLTKLPKDESVSATSLAVQLAGRPLSDVTFVVREGARLAARAGKNVLDQKSLEDALASTPSRTEDSGDRKIGFL